MMLLWRPAERGLVNFDHPDSLDNALLAQHLDSLRAGRTVHVPVYDFASHRRRPETRRAEPRALVLVDGILALADAELRACFDLRVFVDAPEELQVAAMNTHEPGRLADLLGSSLPFDVEEKQELLAQADVRARLETLGLLLARQLAVMELSSKIQAQVGSIVHLVPVDEVIYFEAADKYVRVITADREHLIRLSLKELLPQLDAQRFWQVHRGTIVQARCIVQARREESGKVTLALRGRPETLTASRLYAHLFKGM